MEEVSGNEEVCVKKSRKKYKSKVDDILE